MIYPENLYTERLRLRQFIGADRPLVFKALSHPEVIRFYGVHYHSLADTARQMEFFDRLTTEQTGAWWAICFKQDPQRLVGACGFNNWHAGFRKVEMGYWLLPDHWAQGIMKEALPAIIGFAYQRMQVHRIEAIVETGNAASAGLLKKLDFQYEGTLRDAEIKHGQFISLQYWARLAR